MSDKESDSSKAGDKKSDLQALNVGWSDEKSDSNKVERTWRCRQSLKRIGGSYQQAESNKLRFGSMCIVWHMFGDYASTGYLPGK